MWMVLQKILTISHRSSMGFMSARFTTQSSTVMLIKEIIPSTLMTHRVLLENKMSISVEIVSKEKHRLLQYFLVNRCESTQTKGTTPWIITDCGNVTVDLKQLEFWLSFFLIEKQDTHSFTLIKKCFGPLTYRVVIFHYPWFRIDIT